MTQKQLEITEKELIASRIEYRCDFDTSNISSFRIGGRASFCVFPNDTEELIFVLELAKSLGVRYKLIGNGSNLLFSDRGYDGVIITSSSCNEVKNNGDGTLYAECGVPLTYLSSFAASNGLSGLEFAYGIPGSVGGGVFMNAGAYGGEMKDVIASCTFYDAEDKKIKRFSRSECEFAYRTSVFAKKTNYIILSAELSLTYADEDAIRKTMKEYMDSRREKQPLEYHSAGSTFKRPEGYIAAKLIDEAGLKGLRVGEAQVSEKHAGFIVNLGGASSEDVLALMEKVRKHVFELYGVTLESEIEYID